MEDAVKTEEHPWPCYACPLRQHFHGSQSNTLRFGTEGLVSVQTASTNIRSGGWCNIPDEVFQQEHPSLVEKMKHCSGPIEDIDRVPRWGMFGWLGLKKNVVVQECPVLSDQRAAELAQELAARFLSECSHPH